MRVSWHPADSFEEKALNSKKRSIPNGVVDDFIVQGFPTSASPRVARSVTALVMVIGSL